MPATEVATHDRFECTGVEANPKSAAYAREEFASWLDRFFDTDPFLANDIVMAVNEALANSAEFAYEFSDQPGTIDVWARYDAHDAKLTATIADQGVWRMPVPGKTENRGRGVPLMRLLSDRAVIETSSDGTRVCLEWHGIRQS